MKENEQNLKLAQYQKALEYHKVLALLENEAASEEAKEEILKLKPATTLAVANKYIEETKTAMDYIRLYMSPSFLKITNPSSILTRAEKGGVLSLLELLEVNKTLRSTKIITNYFESTEGSTVLTELYTYLVPVKELEKRITSSVVDENEMADGASEELASIRHKIKNANKKVRDQLEKITSSKNMQKYLQEQIVTLRDGRYVVPVKSEHKNEVKGIVHDTSSSGATMFIEPVSVVEANNEIRLLAAKEKEEIHKILKEITATVAAHSETIISNYKILISLDIIFAKARFAGKIKGTIPELNEKGITVLKKARHPLIDSSVVVPIDIHLGEDFNTLVITGPNTGGKTVALKTMGLFTLMAMAGLALPAAENSKIAVYEKVLVDIGDEQSIEQSLSTFSGHMKNIISILDLADNKSLVLLDELGAGTDPVEGAALAVSILETLREKGANIAATTHYPEVKIFALETKGVENASCEFDVDTLKPTYRILIGVPGRSNAFAISGRLGLTNDIIEKAKSLVSGEEKRFENVMEQLEKNRQATEQALEAAEEAKKEALLIKSEAKKELEAQKAKEETYLAKAREEAEDLVKETEIETEKLLEDLTNLLKEKDKTDFNKKVIEAKAAAKGKLNKLGEKNINIKESEPTFSVESLKAGDRVHVITLNKDGVLLATPGSSRQVQVQVGVIKTTVPVKQLTHPKEKKPPAITTSGVNKRAVKAKASEGGGRNEVDIRGMNAEEGLMLMDRFIDRSVLSNMGQVTVIHGKGTGVLRDRVRSHLRRHPSVRSSRPGLFGEGEDGVTVAELK